MADLTDDAFRAARERGDARLEGPRAVSAHYDAGRGRVIIRLTSGIELGLAPRDVQGLENASREDLSEIEIEPFGLGVHFPRLDADLYVPALVAGVLGSRSWMAARLGAEGGKARTLRKAAAARANGKRGGRPRKVAAT